MDLEQSQRAAGDDRGRDLKQSRAVLTRERILTAAAEVARRQGVADFTLDKVAETAGVSKGGLLYHFPSKDDLIVALLDQTLRATELEIEARAAEMGGEPGAFAVAYLEYVREPNRPDIEFASSLLAAVAIDPRLLANARATFARWSERLMSDDGIDPATGLLARVVSEGIWLIDLFGLAPPSESERAEVLALTIDLIRSSRD